MSLYFSCHLLSPVVLTSLAATEGFHPSLDYIPGSVFLGIVAKDNYPPKGGNQQEILDLFHNGNVSYGDAHLAIDEAYSYATPFAWYRQKSGADDAIYIHHLMGEVDQQLRQQRGGYINSSGTKRRKIDQTFSIKSAYNTEKRKSLDENMFGYHALPAGLTFLFRVTITGEEAAEYAKKIRASFAQEVHHIGRSRSAEYGLVKIKEVDKAAFQHLPRETKKAGTLVLYAASNWCFHDDYGFPTAQLTPSLLKLESGTINWQKSQLRFEHYQSFNSHRRNLNPAAIIIKKGSVLVLDNVAAEDYSGDEMIVGNWKAEGFGHCLINPAFLMDDAEGIRTAPEESLLEAQPTERISIPDQDEVAAKKDLVLGLLQNRADKVEAAERIRTTAENHTGPYDEVTNSQWGLLRGIAKVATSKENLIEMLFEPSPDNSKTGTGILLRGKADKKIWTPEARETLRRLLKDEEIDNPMLLLDRVANKFQKETNGK